jgi:two-component system chemotaxis response regulator CheB
MARKKVLIVDDSALFRQNVARSLSGTPGLEFMGLAGSGEAAMALIAQTGPDFAVVDLVLPDIDGVSLIEQMKRQWPMMRAVLLSGSLERLKATDRARLARAGATCVAKPSESTAADSMSRLREELVRIVTAGGRPALGPLAGGPSLPAPALPPAQERPASFLYGPARRAPTAPPARFTGVVHFDAVTIGSSTGGPEALAQLVTTIPANFPAPILMVQHMPANFTRLLAERLSSRCALPVAEAVSGEAVVPGRIYLAPGGRHLALTRAAGGGVVARLHDEPPVNHCRPAVDVLFDSAAELFGRRCLAMVLTGMGTDGAEGARKIHRAGGTVLIQDAATSVVWGMPGAVSSAGVATATLAIHDLGPAMVQRVMGSALLGQSVGGAA